ncbi:Uncharacterised protein [Burkholderia pseudomallei]|nr:Uncharacterised protein [Burkholderia pseudomallei]
MRLNGAGVQIGPNLPHWSTLWSWSSSITRRMSCAPCRGVWTDTAK